MASSKTLKIPINQNAEAAIEESIQREDDFEPQSEPVNVAPISALEVQIAVLTREKLALEKELESIKQDYGAELERESERVRAEVYGEVVDQAKKDVAAQIEAVHLLESNFAKSLDSVLSDFETNVSKIVLAAVGKILGSHLIRPEASMAAVKEVLQRAGHQERMRVHVSPKDHMLLDRYRRQITSASNLDFIADDRVKIGGCLVELDRGMLDGRIEVQLQTLVDILTGLSES